MTYCIANQMEQRIHHPFDDDFVEFRILARNVDLHLFMRVALQPADDETHSFKDLCDGNHPRADHRMPQIPHLSLHDAVDFAKRAQAARRQAFFRRLECLVEMGTVMTISPTIRISSSSRFMSTRTMFTALLAAAAAVRSLGAPPGSGISVSSV